jgi:acetoin:2,6-dichlorophenolindophenol oxidoreductase subunit alpha
MAQSVHQKIERVSERAAAYSMPGVTVDGNDVEAVHAAAGEAVARARGGGGPTLLECVTYRWRGHYEGDPQPYRGADEVERWKLRDPLRIAERRLAAAGALDETARADLWEETARRIEEAVAAAAAAPMPSPEQALEDVYAVRVEEGWP